MLSAFLTFLYGLYSVLEYTNLPCVGRVKTLGENNQTRGRKKRFVLIVFELKNCLENVFIPYILRNR